MQDLSAPSTWRPPPLNGGRTPRWLFAAVRGAVAIVVITRSAVDGDVSGVAALRVVLDNR